MQRVLRGAVTATLVAAAASASYFGLESTAEAQEIQLTGPLAGAPAVRKLRLHREGRFEVTPNVSFTLLDEYNRTILPGLRAHWHPTDWFGFGVWGGYGFQYTTGLSDQLQEKAINERNCAGNPAKRECALTAVNLTKGDIFEDQLARMQWVAAAEANFIPFRGKLALFSLAFVDTDVNIFGGVAVVGVQERKQCESNCAQTFGLESRVAVAPTFGIGLNFYPTTIFGFGAEWRALPFALNTGGLDTAGGGPDGDFPDNKVNGDDQQFKFNSMITVNFIFRFPDLVTSE